MSAPVVLVTASAIAEEVVAPLRAIGAEVVFMREPIDEKALLAEFARRPITAVVLRGPAPFTRAVFEAANGLRIISKNGAGYDSVDLESATAHGVALMVTNGANADAVAEHSLALMLALRRELPRFDAGLRKGVWKNPAYQAKDFRGSMVGIVGYGQIGRRTALMAQACGASVLVHSRSRRELPPGMEWVGSLAALLPRVDILSLHCPLTEETRGMIGASELALMKPGGYLVNTSRGNLVDEPALIAALKDGRLAGAGLDVYMQEPADASNPLFALANVIVTPHVASSTRGAASQMGVIGANNIISYLRGEVYDPGNFINPEVSNSGKTRKGR